MFTRITESGGRRYLQIVESFRNEAGKPRLRVIANLGRVDEMKDGQLDALIRGLSRAAGRTEPAKLEIRYGAARASIAIRRRSLTGTLRGSPHRAPNT